MINAPLGLADPFGLGTWTFSISKGDYRWFPSPLVTVSYTMDAKEKGCCAAFFVHRFAQRLYAGMIPGGWGRDEKTGTGPGGTIFGPGYAEFDEPGSILPLLGYVMPTTANFRWDAVCSSGPYKGKTLSSITRTFVGLGNTGQFGGDDVNSSTSAFQR